MCEAFRKRAGRGRSKADASVRQEGYTFDVAYTSLLKRAIRTLWTILDEMDLMMDSVHRSWRHHTNATMSALQG